MFSVRISSPLGLSVPIEQELLNPYVVSGSFGTNILGGFTTAQLSIGPPFTDIVPEGAHVEILGPGDGGGGKVAWEGKRRRPQWAGRYLTNLELAGYSVATMDANPLQTAGLASATEQQYPAAECLATALAQAPLITVNRAQWGQPNVQHGLSLFDGQTPWQVADRLSTESGYAFMVYEGRRAIWVARTPPVTPQYQVPIDECADWEVDDSTVFTQIYVTYTDAINGNTETVGPFTNAEAEVRIGGRRMTVVNAGTTDAAGATAYGQTQLALSAFPAITATLGPVSTLRLPNGDRAPGWGIRSGEWVQVGELYEQDIRGTVQIVQTSCDFNGMVTCQLGRPVQNIFGILTEVARVAVAVKQGTNALTGAPA